MKNLIILAVIAVSVIGLEFCFGPQSLIPISSAFALIAVAVGIWLALEQYSLKLRSQKVETDIQLMTLFTQIMKIAHARGGYSLSEKTIEKLFENGALSGELLRDPARLNDHLKDAALFTTPVGEAEQEAAISAITALAHRHPVLKEVAIQGLKSIKKFKPDPTNKCLTELGVDASE